MCEGPSLSWSYGGWIYNYLFNQCLSPLKLWVWIPLRRSVLDTTLCDEVCQWLATGWLFSPVFSTNKTDRHNITEILMKVALNIITLTPVLYMCVCVCVCVIIVYRKMSKFSAISWREQFTFSMKWWWGPLCTRPTAADRQVALLGHIILIPSQPVFALPI